MIPYFEARGLSLFHGDCLTLVPMLPQRFDMVLADLPYGTTRNHWDRELPNKLLWHAYHSVCGPRTAIVVFGSGLFSARFMVDNLPEYRYSLVWDKQAVSGFLNSKRQPLRCHEDLMVFYGRQPTYHPQMVRTDKRSHSRGSRRDRTVNHYSGFENTVVPPDQEEQYPRSILTFKRPKEGLHPSQKPLDLCRWLIRTYTNPGDIVLDNVCGSGTTLLAAALEGRRAIGIELEEAFCETATNRLRRELALA